MHSRQPPPHRPTFPVRQAAGAAHTLGQLGVRCHVPPHALAVQSLKPSRPGRCCLPLLLLLQLRRRCPRGSHARGQPAADGKGAAASQLVRRRCPSLGVLLLLLLLAGHQATLCDDSLDQGRGGDVEARVPHRDVGGNALPPEMSDLQQRRRRHRRHEDWGHEVVAAAMAAHP